MEGHLWGGVGTLEGGAHSRAAPCSAAICSPPSPSCMRVCGVCVWRHAVLELLHDCSGGPQLKEVHGGGRAFLCCARG